MGYVVGIDTGGTFTDAVAIDDQGVIRTGKALSTPPKFEEGIMNALQAVAEAVGTNREDLLKHTDVFCFGTTVATNALWTRTGAKAGLLTTAGFEDTHHIARGLSKWAGLPEAEIKHQSAIPKPVPLVPKELVIGIDERIDYKGRVVCPLDREKVKEAIRQLADKGVEAIAVCFLWSIRNPVHEKQVKELVSNAFGEIYSTYSAELASALGEYERFNTAIIDAYVGPVTSRFLTALTQRLKDGGLEHEILIMKADGGTVSASEALPLATIHSGPAGGVVGASFVAKAMGYEDVITADVGGTSFDVSLIKEGSVLYSREPTLEQFSVSYPSLNVRSIGAGGGSIIWADPALKTLSVGPKSAGANPGPACYGFGGVEPTITDANLVLGYLNPDYFLGGKMKLYPEKAFEAVKRVALPLGMDPTELAAGAYDIVNAHMTDLMRATTVERGFDPRDFLLFCFGGAGPAHAAVWKTELAAKAALVSPHSSVFSALGIATSDLLYTRTLFDQNSIPMDAEKFNRNFETLEGEVNTHFDREGIRPEDRNLLYFLEMKYGVQFHVVRISIPRKKYGDEDMEFIAAEFDRVFEGIYGRGSAYTRAGRMVINFIVQGVGRVAKPPLAKYGEEGPDASKALKGTRDAFFAKYRRYVTTNIYDYGRLRPGNLVDGPAIIETPDTTVVIPPDQRGKIDRYLNILIE